MSQDKKVSFKMMILAAIEGLKGRSGSSIPAIGKYIAHTYGVDTEKSKVHIKRYLKKAVESGELIQTKGKGFTGSFKISKTKKTELAKEKTKAKKAEKKSKSPKTASGKKQGPKASAAVKPKKPKGSDDVNDEKGLKLKIPMKKKIMAKSNQKKTKASVKEKDSKIVLKRASLIGNMKPHKTTKKRNKTAKSTPEAA